MPSSGDKLVNEDIVTANGTYNIRMSSQVNMTVNWVAGTGTVKLYQAGQSTTVLDGFATAGYTGSFAGLSKCGDIDVVVSGTSGAQIQFFIKPVYSTP